ELRTQRASVQPNDSVAVRGFNAREAAANTQRTATLDRIITQDSSGYFARVILTDRRVMAALPQGAEAIARTFPWADAGLMHSSIYPKAVMAYLQKLPFEVDGGLRAGADSVLHWASPD